VNMLAALHKTGIGLTIVEQNFITENIFLKCMFLLNPYVTKFLVLAQL
jgi:hypothetical protein